MNLRRIARRITAVALMTSLPAAGFAACEARSGPKTAALIELYTSEGCSSCPPAEHRLSRLRLALDPAAVVIPLALHVGYWDYIGWKDPYAQSAFEQRQNWLVHANRGNTLYTPQIFVGGTELRAWRDALPEEVRRLNALPAAAAISLRAAIGTDGALALEAEATAHAGGDPAALYLALAENGLLSRVARGENGGKVLAHDHVVRAWIGPIRLAAGKARVRRELVLSAAWNRADLELVVFVQDERSGAVLQALNAQQCAAS